MMVKRKNRQKPIEKQSISPKNELKRQFLKYFSELPNYDLACDSIGRDQSVVHKWEKHDAIFASQIDKARATWALAHCKRIKDKEWLLERILKSHFSGRQELTGANGKDLPVPLGKNLLT
jgi:hypothetical protein